MCRHIMLCLVTENEMGLMGKDEVVVGLVHLLLLGQPGGIARLFFIAPL